MPEVSEESGFTPVVLPLFIQLNAFKASRLWILTVRSFSPDHLNRWILLGPKRRPEWGFLLFCFRISTRKANALSPNQQSPALLDSMISARLPAMRINMFLVSFILFPQQMPLSLSPLSSPSSSDSHLSNFPWEISQKLVLYDFSSWYELREFFSMKHRAEHLRGGFYVSQW